MARQTRRSGTEPERVREVKPAVIPVVHEQATVTKRVVETGRVHIAKHLREYEEIVDIPHIQEEVKIERVPVNRFVDAAPQVRTEGETTIIPVLEERYVIEKRLFLAEELHVSKQRNESHYPEKVKVLKEVVEVRRVPAADTTAPRARSAKTRQ